jgi:AcrR family transcriptional regulator
VPIVESAIAVFAHRGYADATIEDVAVKAGVAPTAIYYHFGGKDDLFHEALRHAMEGFSIAVRPSRGAADSESLRMLLRAGWHHWRTHPDAALLVGRYSSGNSAQVRQLRRDWEERHRSGTTEFIEGAARAHSPRRARERKAVDALVTSFLFDVILATHAASVESGVIGRLPKTAVQAAVEDMCIRLMNADTAIRVGPR